MTTNSKNAITLIFPHQLFKEHPGVKNGREVWLIEEWLFFRQYNFHRQKLVLHRASMQFYAQYLRDQGLTVHYIESTSPHNDCRKAVANMANYHIKRIYIADVSDNWLLRRLKEACADHHLELIILDSPNWLNTVESTSAYFDRKRTYFQTDFYKWQRLERDLLLEPDGRPLGGRWTFDADNRKKFPKKGIVPPLPQPAENTFLTEAQKYVQQYFPNNYGKIDGPHLFCVTYSDAEKWLEDFLRHRFEKFGIYEDAIVANEHVLHHSVLTPMLNIGLLLPGQIIEAALDAAVAQNIPFNSLEGFIRQTMGWREFIHLVYEREGVRQRTKNYWGFDRKIPDSFWSAETGIAPIDRTIRKILDTGYCHHIERLMILGNFMLLCEFDPNEVYRWFMELFIDAYDWVMVPNIYGMTQFADGGLMMTKPYISGSNYLMKMSDYPTGNWQKTWDALFWRFMHVHREFFSANPRLGMLVNTWDKMPEEKRETHLTIADSFLASLDRL